jgi:hypothetical protein
MTDVFAEFAIAEKDREILELERKVRLLSNGLQQYGMHSIACSLEKSGNCDCGYHKLLSRAGLSFIGGNKNEKFRSVDSPCSEVPEASRTRKQAQDS